MAKYECDTCNRQTNDLPNLPPHECLHCEGIMMPVNWYKDKYQKELNNIKEKSMVHSRIL